MNTISDEDSMRLNNLAHTSFKALQNDGPSVEVILNSLREAFELGASRRESTQPESFEFDKGSAYFNIIRKLFVHLMEHPDSARPSILNGVRGRTSEKRKAFNELVSQGYLLRTGEGSRGSPYTYRLSSQSHQ